MVWNPPTDSCLCSKSEIQTNILRQQWVEALYRIILLTQIKLYYFRQQAQLGWNCTCQLIDPYIIQWFLSRLTLRFFIIGLFDLPKVSSTNVVNKPSSVGIGPLHWLSPLSQRQSRTAVVWNNLEWQRVDKKYLHGLILGVLTQRKKC